VELQTAAGKSYQWQAGIGPQASIVAFAAICAHKLSYPTRPISFIGYRQQPVGFLNAEKQIVQRSAVIQCCSEHSIYDPAAGARVLSGPAPQPLTSIALEEHDGELFVTGVYGGLLYERFFERFGFQLELDFGETARELVAGTAWVRPTEEYTRQRVQC
jgi:Rieske Fe-S protein